MELIYYRNFSPNSFFSEAEFNLSSKYELKSTFERLNAENDSPILISSIDAKLKEDYNLYTNKNVICDAKVIVGGNGVGKSSLLDEILAFIIQSNLSLSWQILIGSEFILIGDKLKLNNECIELLEKITGKKTLYTSFSNSYNTHVLKNHVLKSNESFVQAINEGKSSLIYYSNSLDNHKLPHLSGDLYARSQLAEEGVSLVDISTANMHILSNRWGIDSMLRELVKEDHLVSLDNYQMTSFLELYLKTDWFRDLIPISLQSRLNIRIHYSPLVYKFNSILFTVLGHEPIQETYPNFYEFISNTTKSHSTELYSEFISALNLKLLDKIYEPSSFYKNITQVLQDFETSTKSISLKESKINDETIIKLLEEYINKSALLPIINADSLYLKFKALNQTLLNSKEINQQFVINGLSDVNGLVFNLQRDKEVLKNLTDVYEVLQSDENFRMPLLKFSPDRISSGERNYLFLLSRLIQVIDSLAESGGRPDNFTVFMDEPGNDYHPQWQKQFFNNLNNALNKYAEKKRIINVHLIITTHSPFILSDFKSSQIIKLISKGNKTVIAPYNKETFGANIYDLLADSFYLDDGFMGDFAKEKISDLVRYLTYDPDEKKKKSDPPRGNWNEQEAEKLINIIGEPLIKERAKFLYDKKFSNSNESELKTRIDRLQKELKKLQQSNEENSNR